MSSSYIVEPEESQSKKDDTLIIVVNDDGTIAVDQETLQNLIMNQSNANVSVVRVGQGDGDSESGGLTLTVDPPTFATTTPIGTLSGSSTDPNILVDPFMEMDKEQLERLEIALQSEQAKQILGENVTAMLDMLSVEEQQNNLRYVVGLDHCYTKKYPAEPAPVEVLPDTGTTQIEEMPFLQGVATSQSTLTATTTSGHENSTSAGKAKTIVTRPTKTATRTRKSTATGPTSTSPAARKSTENEEDEEDSFTESESSESEPTSDDDSDFGPRPRRGGGGSGGGGGGGGGGVRARGGRKGIATRGGSLSATRRRGLNKQMDSEQVRRLDMEMAAAVHAMKSPEKEEKTERFSPGKPKKPVKTFVGKKKDEPQHQHQVLPEAETREKLPQTTNRVKANLVSANMFQGDMILTKPGQARSNNAQKMTFLQKQQQQQHLATKTAPGDARTSQVPDKPPTTPGTDPKPPGCAKNTIPGATSSVATTPIGQKTLPVASPSPEKQQGAVPGKARALEVKREKRKSDASLEPTVKSDVETKTHESATKKHAKKEHRKPPAYATEGPALFSTPDIIRRVGSVGESKAPELTSTSPTPTMNTAAAVVAPSTTTTTSATTSSSTGPPSELTTLLPGNHPATAAVAAIAPPPGINEDPTKIELNLSTTSALDSGSLPRHLSEDISEDQKDMKPPLAEELQPSLDPESKTDSSERVTVPAEQTIVPNHIDSEQSGIEGEEHLLATLEMEASKHEEELLAEALLLQEELGVDLADHPALDEQPSEPLLQPTPFLSPIIPPEDALKQQQPEITTSSPSVPDPVLPPNATSTTITTTPETSRAQPLPPVTAAATPGVAVPVPAASVVPGTPGISRLEESKKGKDKEPIQIVRGGRVITLPPIEAPATRSKRLQAKQEISTPATTTTTTTTTTTGTTPSRSSVGEKRHDRAQKQQTSHQQKKDEKRVEFSGSIDDDEDDEEEGENSDSEDDPDRLWCICKQPHNNRFMICCDVCEDWFHGKCVHVSKAMGQQMEEQGMEWVCPNCRKKTDDSRMTPSTSKHQTKAAAAESLQNFASKSAAGPSTSTSTSTSPLVIPEKAIPTSVSTSQLPVTQCVVCKREARSSSIYCSDACILAHAQETLTKESKPEVQPKTAMVTTTTTTPTPTMTKLLPDGAKAKAESRVIVFDKTTGTVLAGAAAPTTSNLKTWLREHPTYEVVRPNNLNTFQLGGKTVTAIPTQVNKANKSVPHGIIKLHQQQQQQHQQQQSQPKMIYTKVAGSKQTILAPSTKKITIISTGNQGPALQTKTVHVKSLGAQQNPSPSHQTLAKKGPSLGPKTIISPQQRPPGGGGGGGGVATKKPPDVKSSPSAAATSSFPGSASSSSSSSAKVQTKLPVTKKVAEPEPIRLNVRKTLAELLTGRIKATEDLKLTDPEIGDLALNIELELYKFFKDTGAKYKAKYRSLVFNIKDTKNLTLFRKIADRSLTPDAVVKLSPEEMASQELAEWREKETKHQLEMIKKNELDLMAQAKSIVVKTHKGEQIIENDGVIDDRVDPKTPVQDIVSALNDPEVTGGTATIVPEDKWEKKPKLEETRKRDKDERRNRDRDSRSHSRNRHRDRDKDREHGKSKESRRSSSTRSKESRRDKEKERDRAKVRDKDRPKEKHKRNKSRKESHRDKERKDEAEDLVPRKDIIIGGVEKKKWGIAEGQKSSEEGKNAVDGNDSDVSDREPSSTVTIKTPDINEDIDKEKDSEIEKEIVQVFNKSAGQQLVQPVQQVAHLVQKTVWRGFVSMIDVAKFFITAQEISGNARDLMEDLPDTIDVVGRITYDIVWDYIAKMKKNNSKEILVIRLTAANDEEKIPYITFYSYLHSRSRMGVIGNVSKNIKDFYIMPFPNTSPVPQVLLPLNGPVFEENRPHLLLGIIVRIKRKRPSNLPPSSSTSNVIPVKIAKKDNADRSYTPPLVSSNPHKEKPSGQELLKQLPFDVFPEKKSEPKVVLGRGTVDAAAVISKIVPELSSKIDLVTSSPQGRLEDEEEEEDEEEHRRQQGTTSSVSEKKVDDDDEPYSPSGAIDDDDEDEDNNVVLESAGNNNNNNNLLTVESSTTIETTMQTVSSVSVDLVSSNPLDDSSNSELQRNLDELNRRIEEQKQEIQNMIGDSTSTLPGLTLDPVTMADGDEAYSPSDTRSFTPPPISKLAQPLLDTVSSITIPPNLQEILANVKRQESTQQKVDPYLPSKPSASFLTSTFYSKPEKYTPSAFSKRNHHPVVVSVGTGDCSTSGTGSTGVATEPKETSKSTLRELSDQDLIKKAEEELAAVAAAAMLPVAQSNAATSPGGGGGGGGGGQTHPKESVFHPSPPKKPPGVDDHEEYVPPLPPLPPPPPTAGSGQKFVPKSGIVMSVKRKLGEDSSASSSSSSSSTSSSCSSPKQQITKITRTKSRWGQGPPE